MIWYPDRMSSFQFEESLEEIDDTTLSYVIPLAVKFHQPLCFEPKRISQDWTPLHQEDLTKALRQMVCWILHQRFWYYIIGEAQVTDFEYDFAEKWIAVMEQTIPQNPVQYSPSISIGSTLVTAYPPMIRSMFTSAGFVSGEFRIRYPEVQNKRFSNTPLLTKE